MRYQLFVADLRNERVEVIEELHQLRYLFQLELKLLAEGAGIRIESSGAWMSAR